MAGKRKLRLLALAEFGARVLREIEWGTPSQDEFFQTVKEQAGYVGLLNDGGAIPSSVSATLSQLPVSFGNADSGNVCQKCGTGTYHSFDAYREVGDPLHGSDHALEGEPIAPTAEIFIIINGKPFRL